MSEPKTVIIAMLITNLSTAIICFAVAWTEGYKAGLEQWTQHHSEMSQEK